MTALSARDDTASPNHRRSAAKALPPVCYVLNAHDERAAAAWVLREPD